MKKFLLAYILGFMILFTTIKILRMINHFDLICFLLTCFVVTIVVIIQQLIMRN